MKHTHTHMYTFQHLLSFSLPFSLFSFPFLSLFPFLSSPLSRLPKKKIKSFIKKSTPFHLFIHLFIHPLISTNLFNNLNIKLFNFSAFSHISFSLSYFLPKHSLSLFFITYIHTYSLKSDIRRKKKEKRKENEREKY